MKVEIVLFYDKDLVGLLQRYHIKYCAIKLQKTMIYVTRIGCRWEKKKINNKNKFKNCAAHFQNLAFPKHDAFVIITRSKT